MSEQIESSGTGLTSLLTPGQIVVHSQAEYEGHAAKGALPSVKVDVWAMPFDGETPEAFEARVAAFEEARFETASRLARRHCDLVRAAS